MKHGTCDLCDAHPELQVAQPVFRDFGGASRFSGAIATLKVLEDNALVRAALEKPGDGQVLVVDGGGSLRTALVGGNLAALAHENRWAGIVVFGAVRDVRELAAVKIGIKALAACPKKSAKTGAGYRDVPVGFAGVGFSPGAWLYADEDGLVVSDQPI